MNDTHNIEKCDGKSGAKEDIIPVRATHLTPRLIEEAREQLNETEENRRKCLAEFRKIIEEDTRLSSPTDDQFLLAFLRARKFDVERSFKLLENFWSFRKEYKHIYDGFKLQSMKNLILRSFLGFLWHRDRNGCAVYITKVGEWDPDIDPFEDLFRAMSGMLVYSLSDEATQVTGWRIIFDLRGLQWRHLKYINLSNILLLVKSTQFCFPARYKGIHLISDNKLFDLLWTLCSPFLSSKLKKRIFVHGEDLTPLREYIHPSVLPIEFGGEAPRFNNDAWPDIIDCHYEESMKLLKYGYKD